MALTYRTITETLDFGPHITKIILEAGRPLTGATRRSFPSALSAGQSPARRSLGRNSWASALTT